VWGWALPLAGSRHLLHLGPANFLSFSPRTFFPLSSQDEKALFFGAPPKQSSSYRAGFSVFIKAPLPSRVEPPAIAVDIVFSPDAL